MTERQNWKKIEKKLDGVQELLVREFGNGSRITQMADDISGIKTHLVKLNGHVAENTREILDVKKGMGCLPCNENRDEIVRLKTVMEEFSPGDVARIQERMGLYPDPFDAGRDKERLTIHTINWKRIWGIASAIIIFLLTAALGSILII